MQGRFQARGLVVVLAIAILLLLSPTPVSRPALEAWRTGAHAAAAGDAGALAESLQALEVVFPWAPEPRLSQIPVALASGDGARALGLLDTGAASRADPAAAACWRSEALMLVGDWDAAMRSLPPTASGTCPQALLRLSSQADEALANLDLHGAIVLLRAVTSTQPANPDTQAMLGASLLLTDAEAATAILGDAAASGSQLASDLLTALEGARAADEITRLALAGEVFLQRQQWPLAAMTFERLTALDPTNAEAHAYLGLALQKAGQDGRSALELAGEMAPDSPLTLSALGLYWQEAGEPGKARAYLQRAADLDADNAAFRASLAAAQAASGDVQAALATFLQAAQIEPATPVFWELLADFSLARRLEVAETGLPAARNAAALQPSSAKSLDTLGYAHLLLGNYALAERLLVRAISLDPLSASARLHYGLLLRALVREAEAAAQLQAASGLGGNTPTGEMARRALSPLSP